MKNLSNDGVDYLVNNIGLEMVLISAGKFVMGSPESEENRHSNETQHEVTLTKPFYIGKFPVTQEQFEALMGNNPSYTKGEKLPVTNVSWDDCQAFIKKLNAKTNGGYRLPTEAEWEYACRAGTSTAYSFGKNITPKNANYFDSNIGEPTALGSNKPNAFGLYDMHGNVWEWCEDWYGDYPVEAVKDPKGPQKNKTNNGYYREHCRVLRGGSFYSLVGGARSSCRNYNHPGFTHEGLGFRLARTEVGVQVATPKITKKKPGKAVSPSPVKKNKSEGQRKEPCLEDKKKDAKKVLLMLAGGQWKSARKLLKAAQEKHWLFEELLEGCGIEDGVVVPSIIMKKIFGEDGYHVGLLEVPEYDLDPDDYLPIRSELAMLEVLAHLPRKLKKLQKLKEKLGIHERVLSKYWKEDMNGTFAGVEYDPVNFSDRWIAGRDAMILTIEKECKSRGKVLKMPWLLEEDLGNGIKIEMILIPPGNFVMGSPKSELNRNHDETQNKVTLTRPYYMGKFTVTQEQWEKVMGNNPCEHKGEKFPVSDISWDDCQNFLQKLNSKTKGGYRLPTEAEWEYACRAGTKTAYSFGDEVSPMNANYRDSKIGGENFAHLKGIYKPNAFGLYNMHGDVMEWCEDWYGDYPAKTVINPKGPSTGDGRVLRGGNSFKLGSEIRSSYRWSENPSEEIGGIRLVRTI